MAEISRNILLKVVILTKNILSGCPPFSGIERYLDYKDHYTVTCEAWKARNVVTDIKIEALDSPNIYFSGLEFSCNF